MKHGFGITQEQMIANELSIALNNRGYDTRINDSTLTVTYNGMQVEAVNGAYYIKQGKRSVRRTTLQSVMNKIRDTFDKQSSYYYS